MSKCYESVNHPNWGNNKKYNCYINYDTTKLIIGTMPPEFVFNDNCSNKNSRIIDFFYGSSKNKLWKNLLVQDNYKFEDVINYLNDKKIGVVDIVKSCVYNDKYDCNDIDNKKYDDKSLLNIKSINMEDLLLEYKNIKVLFFTSRYAFELFNIFYTKSFIFLDAKNKIGKLNIDKDNSYIFYILKSPSGSARFKKVDLQKDYKILTIPIKENGEEIIDYYNNLK